MTRQAVSFIWTVVATGRWTGARPATRRKRRRRTFAVALLASVLVGGCQASLTSADALRARIAQDASVEDVGNTVIPFEVDARFVDAARKLVRFKRSNRLAAEALIHSLSSRDAFGVEYEDWATLPANEALEEQRGNCFSFAAALVGLARALNMTAYFAEFTRDEEDVQEWGELAVRTGHITALIVVRRGEYMSMEIGRPVRFGRWRIITDAEATAHYYNNRAFERLIEADKRGLPLAWKDAARELTIATKLAPEFYRAWNNLGVVTARLGRADEAIAHYHRAIRFAPESTAAYTNLGQLYLDLGRPQDAIRTLSRASELDDGDANIFFLLGMARWQTGRPRTAVEALERAIEIDDEHEDARELLANIVQGGARPEGPLR